MPFNIGPKIHHIISQELRTLIEDFFSLEDWKGLYLSGGTCLSEYYFGHRVSFDMDLFTGDRVLFGVAIRWFSDPKVFKLGAVESIRKTPHLAQFLFHPTKAKEPIKIDLMLDLVVHLASPIQMGSVWIDSLDDLLANKLGCIIQRNEIKDFLDLFYLIPSSHLTTKELVTLGQKKEGGLDPLIMAQQIEFIFSQRPPEKALLGSTHWKELGFFFKKIQKECLELIQPSSIGH